MMPPPPEKVWSGTILAQVHGVQKTSCCSLIYSCNLKCKKSWEFDVAREVLYENSTRRTSSPAWRKAVVPQSSPNWPFQRDKCSGWPGQFCAHRKCLRLEQANPKLWNTKPSKYDMKFKNVLDMGLFQFRGAEPGRSAHLKHLKSEQLLVQRIPDR